MIVVGDAALAGLAAGAGVGAAMLALRRVFVGVRVRARLSGDADGPRGAGALGSAHGRRVTPFLALVAAVATVSLLGWATSSALCGFGVVAWWARRSQRRRHEARALTRQLPDVLDAVVGVLRSGGSLLEGLRSAYEQPLAPSVHRDLELVLSEIDRGGTMSSALSGWAARRDDADLGTVAGLTSAATFTGGPLATPLARVSATMRQREAQGREVEALVSQARLSAMVLVVLPVGVLPLLDVVGAVPLRDVVADPVSRLAVILGVGLDLLGLAWMRHLVARIRA